MVYHSYLERQRMVPETAGIKKRRFLKNQESGEFVFSQTAFLFVADVISAILLYRSAKRKEAHLLKILRYFNA